MFSSSSCYPSAVVRELNLEYLKPITLIMNDIKAKLIKSRNLRYYSFILVFLLLITKTSG